MLKVCITFDRYEVHALCFCYINLTEIHTIIVCVMCVRAIKIKCVAIVDCCIKYTHYVYADVRYSKIHQI